MVVQRGEWKVDVMGHSWTTDEVFNLGYDPSIKKIRYFTLEAMMLRPSKLTGFSGHLKGSYLLAPPRLLPEVPHVRIGSPNKTFFHTRKSYIMSLRHSSKNSTPDHTRPDVRHRFSINYRAPPKKQQAKPPNRFSKISLQQPRHGRIRSK